MKTIKNVNIYLLHDICLVAVYSRFSLDYHSLHAIGYYHFLPIDTFWETAAFCKGAFLIHFPLINQLTQP